MALSGLGELPLVIDLDHSLVKTDTLAESAVALLFRDPLGFTKALASLAGGRAALKARIATASGLDCSALPIDPAVASLARAHRAGGGSVHLVTAADQSIATAVAEATGLFDTATGSDGTRNLKGAAKADYLRDRFGAKGFCYLGDSRADIPVWQASARALLVGRGGTEAAARRAGIEPAVVIARPGTTLRDWTKALRLHQWSKNLIIFVPLLLLQELLNPMLFAQVTAAFLLFGLVASATYLLNDLADLAADRQHPTKCHRPIAAGRVTVASALVVAMAMLLGALAAAAVLDPGFAALLFGYVLLSLAYSFALKRQALIDLLVIGCLFTMRILAGMILVSRVSMWLSAFALILFTSLATAKRHAELVRAERDGRPVKGRDYRPGDLPLTIAFGFSSAFVAVLVMVLYMEFEAARTNLYASVVPLFLIPLILVSWLIRIWVLSHRGLLHDDPVVFALKDRTSWMHAAAIGLAWLAAVVELPGR